MLFLKPNHCSSFSESSANQGTTVRVLRATAGPDTACRTARKGSGLATKAIGPQGKAVS